MKYYLHEDTGWYDAYFGNIGKPIEVSFGRYMYQKARGYVATQGSDTESIEDIHIKAQIEAGSHPESYHIQELKEDQCVFY